MEKKQYLNELSKLLATKVDVLTDEFVLEQSPLWDSLSMVSTIASIDHYYQVTVKGAEVERCNTVGDIFGLVEQKLVAKGMNG